MSKQVAVVKNNNVVSIKTPVSGTPLHFISTELNKYAGINIDEIVEPAKNYLVYKLFVKSQSDDGMEALNAISLLAKIYGLFTEKVEVSYSNTSSDELRAQLAVLTAKLV